MGDIRTSQFGGIPFGGDSLRPSSPLLGQPYFNGEEKRLELYTTSGWQNIVSETPGVVSVNSTYGAIGTATLQITGTNFTTGAIASVIGTNGVEVQAASTTVNSIVSITAEFTGLNYLNDPYDVKVTNTSNLFGLLPDSLNVNQSPAWQTPSGSLGIFNEQVSITLSALSASDPESSTITYSVAPGYALPSGITLNGVTGVISGTLPDIATDTTYTFTINATDGANVVPRSFSITSKYSVPFEYLVVAGGGGGGGITVGGGGGAGGMLTSTSSVLPGQTITISIGQGGSGSQTSGVDATNGQNSTFQIASSSTITAIGGGAGGNYTGGSQPGGSRPTGNSGGSGGGGGDTGRSGGAGTNGQGYAGGSSGTQWRGGGGGGAGQVGQSAGSSGAGGKGGDGLQSSITGVSTYYAGGGGGCSDNAGGEAGLGGGGLGGGNSPARNSSAGAANTGGGGGGTRDNPSGGPGSAGGSGIVVIAYSTSYPALSNIPGTLTYDQPTTRSGYRVYRFLSGTGTVTV